MEDGFLRAIQDRPDDHCLRLVFSDWLEERGDPRATLLRLLHSLTQSKNGQDRLSREKQLRALLASGIQPVGPYWTNPLGMQFAWVPAGRFLMGSPPEEPERKPNELPHEVTLSRGVFMGVHPVTQEQWRAVMGENPSRFLGEQNPVEGVSWTECQEFCQTLARKDARTCTLPPLYRLPTEAEWEYACRAGTTTPYYFGESISTQQANFLVNHGTNNDPAGGWPSKYREQTTSTGTFPGNAWGLTDMHGNVFEWCADGYAPYSEDPQIDPVGINDGVRVMRGGSWHSLPPRTRSACRAWATPDYRGSDVGVRVCFRPEKYEYVI